MSNLFKRTFTTSVEISKVTVAGGTQFLNIINDGWSLTKDNSEWIKSNAEASWNKAVSTTRASNSNKAAWDRATNLFNSEPAK